MVNWTTAKIRSVSAVALVGVALLVAACGSSASTSSSSASAPRATSSASATKGAPVGTATGSGDTYLTGASGRAVYLWEADSGGRSSCSGACATTWPPLTTSGTPIAGHGVKAGELGTTTRSDGTKQVTYQGHPLYYFAPDTSAGTTRGQGSDSFGAKWWLVAPAGTAITAGSSSGGASSSSSSSGGGY